MVTVGIKNLKDSLSRYLKRVKDGERVLVTDHNRIIAEIVPAPTAGEKADLLETYIREQASTGMLLPATKKKKIDPQNRKKARVQQEQIKEIYEQTRNER